MKQSSPTHYLIRPDKWYLGGEGRLLWAPPFPRFLDRPGFWDAAHYFNFEFGPLFTWTLLKEQSREVPIVSVDRRWNPARLQQRFAAKAVDGAGDFTILENKAVVNETAVSAIEIENSSDRELRLHLVAWSAQATVPEGTAWLSQVVYDDEAIAFTKYLRFPGQPAISCRAEMRLDRRPDSHSIKLSEGVISGPEWRWTPFYESFADGLPGESGLQHADPQGTVFLALHVLLEVKPKSTAGVAIRLWVAPGKARRNSRTSLPGDLITHSEKTWDGYFAQLPQFRCSDEFFQRYYWYRWYGLRLNTIAVEEGHYRQPFVCEGIGYFRAPISYSAPCHMLENRWRHSPELARGSLLTFIDNQREDGGFRGYLDVNRYRQQFFYHANWGRAVLELQRVHPAADFLTAAYEGLRKYAEYFERERDPEGSGLYGIHNHYESGQEYMRRYQAVSEAADREHWGEVFRLKGVDVTVYLYELKNALATIAKELGHQDEAKAWHEKADLTAEAILTKMWDADQGMFFDVDPRTGQRTYVKAAVCFYPYFTEIVDASHLSGLKQHLCNPQEFWTPYPAPASSADDPLFSASPEWRGKRMNCPWNGRVWPMTNSHIAEALATSALRFDDADLRQRTVEFISKFVRMMFFDGDPERPNCFEHYNPFSGKPSLYRGVDDYQHSWVVDLIIKYVCGIRPQASRVVIDPFPFDLEWFAIDRVRIRGSEIRVTRKDSAFSLWHNRKKVAESSLGEAIILEI